LEVRESTGLSIRVRITSPGKKRSAGLSDSRQLLKTKARPLIGAAPSEAERPYGALTPSAR